MEDRALRERNLSAVAVKVERAQPGWLRASLFFWMTLNFVPMRKTQGSCLAAACFWF